MYYLSKGNGGCEMKPEEKAELILWDWLMTKSSYIKQVYFNRTNIINAPVFTTKGVNKKPDLLIQFDSGLGIQFIAVEVKSSDKSKDIHDARKIMDYYKRFVSGETKYFIDNQQIAINHFVVATENSLKGFLFKNEVVTTSNIDSGDHWRKTNAKFKLEPKKEYSLTNNWLRRLWADFRFFRKEYSSNIKPSVGILMNDFANNDTSPYLFIMNYNKTRWGARFWKL